MGAWEISQWCAPWVPAHACIDADDDYATTWAATWSTPDCIWSIEYGESTQTVVITGMWTEVKLRYPQQVTLGRMLDVLLPRCREFTSAERAEIGSLPTVEQTVAEAASTTVGA